MRKELLRSTSGGNYYSFVYYNSKDQRRIRLSRDYIRARFGKDITDAEEADKILEILGRELNTLAQEKDKRLTLTDEEYNFKNLLEMYKEAQMKTAPNSYQNNLHYLKYYVLHFFLRVKECKELAVWHVYYEEFKEWLEHSAYLVKKPDQLISYASKNHAVRALNTFMRHLHKKQIVFTLHICSEFPNHLLKEKSLDEVVTAKEMNKICEGFIAKGERQMATFYRLLFFTGMRFNEARGLSLENIFTGKIENQTFENCLKRHGIEYYGYIVINSQPIDRFTGRDQYGNVKRKPLKTRKKIDEKSSRVIPIIDQQLWKELVQIHNSLLPDYKKRVFGDKLGNYLFFDGISTNSVMKLRKHFSRLSIPYRNFHALRHTRATYLIGETGDFLLARLWLGHKKQEVLEKYVHTYQAIVRSAKKHKGKEIDPIEG